MATNKTKTEDEEIKTQDGAQTPVEDKGLHDTTRSDVGSETNAEVDATRVFGPLETDVPEGQELNADNVVEKLTKNPVALRNAEVADYGTSRQEK